MKNPKDPESYAQSLPVLSAKDIVDNSYVICPNCKQRHGLFYKRHSDTNRTLHFSCDKLKRYNVADGKGSSDFIRFGNGTGNVAFVDNLPISEVWTTKYKDTFQKEHTADLLK